MTKTSHHQTATSSLNPPNNSEDYWQQQIHTNSNPHPTLTLSSNKPPIYTLPPNHPNSSEHDGDVLEGGKEECSDGASVPYVFYHRWKKVAWVVVILVCVVLGGWFVEKNALLNIYVSS